VAKKTKSRRKEYTKDDVKLLKAHFKARTPVVKVSKLLVDEASGKRRSVVL
jgi:hypothetical protein